MITSKVFALSLLLCSPLALARVQLNSVIEIDRPLHKYKRSLATEIQLSADESVTVFQNNELLIKMKLISEQSDKALVQFHIYFENAINNSYELVSAPALYVEYGNIATISIGQSNHDKQIETLKITLTASKA